MTQRRWFAVATATVCVSLALTLHSAPDGAAIVSDLAWRSIGPASVGGRIVDVESLDADPRFLLVASASGGVWKSDNAGTTFTPIFDRYRLFSIQTSPYQRDPRILCRHGRSNNRNDVGWATASTSTDGGQTFANVGLRCNARAHRAASTDTQTATRGGRQLGRFGDRGLRDHGGATAKPQAAD
jgi:hypothetical protein